MSNSKIILNLPLLKIFLIVPYFCFSINSCYKVQFYHDTNKLRALPDGILSYSNSFLSVVNENAPAQIRSECPSGASLVEIEKSPYDGLVGFLSLGLYNPQTIKVWCKRRVR